MSHILHYISGSLLIFPRDTFRLFRIERPVWRLLFDTYELTLLLGIRLMATKGSTHSGEAVEPTDEAFWGFDPILSIQPTSDYKSEKPECITGSNKGSVGNDAGVNATSDRRLMPRLSEHTGEKKRHQSLGLGILSLDEDIMEKHETGS